MIFQFKKVFRFLSLNLKNADINPNLNLKISKLSNCIAGSHCCFCRLLWYFIFTLFNFTYRRFYLFGLLYFLLCID